MKIKESEKKNYDEEYIKKIIKIGLDRITDDVMNYGNIYPSTINTAKILLADLVFFKETVLEEEY